MSEPTGFEKLPGIEGGHGGCLHCGYQHEHLPLDAIIAVGFGAAYVTKGKQVVFDEQLSPDEFKELAIFEEMAKADPNHDWRVHLVAPLSERHYQRQSDGMWVLYEKGPEFA